MDYYTARKTSPAFPTVEEMEARRDRRNKLIGQLMLGTAYIAVGVSLILIVIGNR